MTDASGPVPASRPYSGPVGERGSWGRPQQPANLADILERDGLLNKAAKGAPPAKSPQAAPKTNPPPAKKK